jgi:hypothetical protein
LYTVVIKDERRFWKRLLIVDDDEDVTITFKTAIEVEEAVSIQPAIGCSNIACYWTICFSIISTISPFDRIFLSSKLFFECTYDAGISSTV